MSHNVTRRRISKKEKKKKKKGSHLSFQPVLQNMSFL